jgi:RimJ/RimL family protein N-acetyltransferase
LDVTDRVFVGTTMLFRIDPEARSAELGFWLSPAGRGRGLAVRAIRLTLAWAFDEIGLERVQGLTDADNISSQRVMERAGFVREGVMRGLDRRPTGRVDAVSYSQLATDESRPKLTPASHPEARRIEPG